LARLIRLLERASAGEQRTAADLQSQLPDHWVVICNALIVGFAGVNHEVDFLVVGDHGVYLVDDKEYNGTVVAGRGHWQVGDRQEQNPVEKAEMVARTVAAQLREGVPELSAALRGSYFLHAFVSLSGRADLRRSDTDSTARVVTSDRLPQALLGLDRLPSKKALPIADYRDGIVDYLTAGRASGKPPEGEGEDNSLEDSENAAFRSRRTPLLAAGLVALVLAALLLALTVGGKATSWAEAASHQGEQIWLEGQVVTVRPGDTDTYLNIGRDYPDDARLTARIPAEETEAFEAELGDLEEHFEGQTVKVFGKPTVSRDADDPHVYVDVVSTEDIKVVGVMGDQRVTGVLAGLLAVVGMLLLVLGVRGRASSREAR